jgi:hypothetical protein
VIAKRQRQLQRLGVEGLHAIHVIDDRVDAADGTKGHLFSSSPYIQYG